MTTPDTIKHLAQSALELAEKATPGEWTISTVDCGYDETDVIKEGVGIYPLHIAECSQLNGVEDNARFIAAARTLLPILAQAVLDELEREKANDALLAAAKASEQCIVDFLEIYKNGGSMLAMDEAVKSLKNDALKQVRAAIAKQTAPEPPPPNFP
jgi:hypothetical protein